MKFTAALALVMSLVYATETEAEQYGRGRKVQIEDLLYDDAKDDYRPVDSYGPAPHHGGYGAPKQPEVSASYAVHAKCMLKDPEEENYLGGTISFVQEPYGPVQIWGDIWGITPGPHGFHVHEFGDLRQGCASTGAHWDTKDFKPVPNGP